VKNATTKHMLAFPIGVKLNPSLHPPLRKPRS